jgi:hypothetical protein
LLVENTGVTTHPNAVPRATDATIAAGKLTKYALNPNDARGAHKARVISSALGYTLENWADFRDELLRQLPTVPAVAQLLDEHGQRYRADLEVTGPAGSATVRSGWIVRAEGAAPALTSVYVLKGTKK